MTETTLVLLPGMDGTGFLFEPLVRELPGHIIPRVVSYPPEIPLSYEQLLPLVMAALPTDRPFLLLGESFSGPLAIMAAASSPPQLKGLILCATFVRNPLPWLPCSFRRLAVAPLFRFRPLLMAKLFACGFATPEVAALLAGIRGLVSPEVMAARARAILGVDATDALCKVRVPIFFIGGSRDRLVPSRNRREILRIRGDVHTTLLPGSHMILQENPVEAATVIGKMVREVTAVIGE